MLRQEHKEVTQRHAPDSGLQTADQQEPYQNQDARTVENSIQAPLSLYAYYALGHLGLVLNIPLRIIPCVK